jgi:hypothetical protein
MAVPEHEARDAFSTLAGPQRQRQPVDQVTESPCLGGPQLVEAFDVALGLCDKMAKVDSVADAEDVAGVYQVVLVQDAALDGWSPSMLIADKALGDFSHAHRLPDPGWPLPRPSRTERRGRRQYKLRAEPAIRGQGPQVHMCRYVRRDGRSTRRSGATFCTATVTAGGQA